MLVGGVRVVSAQVGSFDSTGSAGAGSALSFAASRDSLFSTACRESAWLTLENPAGSSSDG